MPGKFKIQIQKELGFSGNLIVHIYKNSKDDKGTPIKVFSRTEDGKKVPSEDWDGFFKKLEGALKD